MQYPEEDVCRGHVFIQLWGYADCDDDDYNGCNSGGNVVYRALLRRLAFHDTPLHLAAQKFPRRTLALIILTADNRNIRMQMRFAVYKI